MPVEHGAARVQLDEERHQNPERRKQDERDRRDEDVRGALHYSRALSERLTEKRDDGEHADLVNLGLARQAVEEARRDAELDAAPPDSHHHVEQKIARHVRVCDDDFVRAGLAYGFGQGCEVCDDGHALELARRRVVFARPSFHDADDAVAQLAPRPHLAHAQSRLAPAPHDERRYQIYLATPDRTLRAARRKTQKRVSAERDDEVEDEDAARVREGAELEAAPV